MLFKRFADVDVFDLEIDATDPERSSASARSRADVRRHQPRGHQGSASASRSRQPCAIVSIPVFHDDQHGTAIITGAALLNALEVAGQRCRHSRRHPGRRAPRASPPPGSSRLGVRREQIFTPCDRKGVIHRGRMDELNPHKAEFAFETSARSLADALRGADVLLGLSSAGPVTQDMVRRDGGAADPLRLRQPRSRDQLSRREGRAAGRDHGHGALRLSEPGEQRPRLPLPLPGRPRRAPGGSTTR